MGSNNLPSPHTINWFSTWKSKIITPLPLQQEYGHIERVAQNYVSVLTTLELNIFTRTMHIILYYIFKIINPS